MNTSSLDHMTLDQIGKMIAARQISIMKILEIPHEDLSLLEIQSLLYKHSYKISLRNTPVLSIHDVFDETNAAIGTDWIWEWGTYYFARESDAMWFAMRWA